MTIKDSIVNLKKGLRTTLTNVPALIDTLIRGLDGVAEAAEEQTTYSTDERVVGTWIDGSDIYEKTINTGAMPNTTTKDVLHGITNLGKVIEIKGIMMTSDSKIAASIPAVNPGGDSDLICFVYIDGANIKMKSNSNYSVYSESYVTIKYLKASASRSPEENDTKNGGDEENEEVKNER